MSTVTAFEARTRFGELLERVARGEEIVITQHDKPVARIIPAGERSLAEVRRAVAGLRALSAKLATRGRKAPSAAEVRAAVAQGRR